MVTTRFYLDCRDCTAGNPAPLKLVITKKGVRALISLNLSLLPSQWDAGRQTVIGHPRKQQFNTLIAERKLAVDAILFRLESSGELSGLRSCDVKQRVLSELYPDDEDKDAVRLSFVARFSDFVARRSPGTQRVYNSTLARLRAYLPKKADTLTFEEMDVAWLRGFDAFLAKTSPSRNARNIHFRNIRAVFNDAITEELITCYPFRKFKISPERTRKRALTVEQLRELFSAKVAPHEQRYLDCFKLIFMLCGINVVDLCRLRSLSAEGRVEYSRAKTHRPYSIKVEPECAEILARYQGQSWLLSYLDTCANYRSFYSRFCKTLRDFKVRFGLPGLSSYWARHSWATIAASLDIPKETIAAALGHGGSTVTDIYIDFDRSKIDRANRRVLDWVLYGKSE
ncbi:MAG: site-specific integrase [Duncaniella sp.]|nr:site-specific integrase [Duncaniella sp.]